MNTSELTKAVNLLTDEDFSVENVTSFLNDAIAEINTECKAKYPFLSDENPEPHLPEEWQRTLLVVYAAAKVKQNDSSQFEYSDLYNQFYEALNRFKRNYTIPEEYRTGTSGPSFQDFSDNWYRW